jgi:deoxyribodipyrimidine photo-lyase
MTVTAARVLPLNRLPPRGDGAVVLYWMHAHRRRRWNAALEHAVAVARSLARPLLVVEALDVRRQWSCARFHRFFLDGMADNARDFAGTCAAYRAWVARRPDDGARVVAELAPRVAAVVLDHLPYGHIPAVNAALAARFPVRVEAVDANGLLPLAASTRTWERAVDFRRFVQRELPAELLRQPAADPLTGISLPTMTLPTPWACDPAMVEVGALPIDQAVAPVGLRGGAAEARRRLAGFLAARLDRYHDGRNQVDDSAASGLSPWLRCGHLAAQEIAAAVWERHGWDPGRVAGRRATAAKDGWWGLPPGAEALLDQLVTWRELGFHDAARRDTTAYDLLPAWARSTLANHAGDPHPHLYDRAQLETAATHDPLWNAAQTQLRREGVMHNYLRMLWGKKVLEWSPGPQAAHAALFALNDRWALDGCNPNSATGIMWCLGRYDRPWPERAVFGTVRCMTSDSTRRKLDVRGYLARYGGDGQESLW